MLHYILVQNILIFRRIKIRTTTFAMHDMKLTGLVCRDVFANLKYVHGLPAICSKVEKIFTKKHILTDHYSHALANLVYNRGGGAVG